MGNARERTDRPGPLTPRERLAIFAIWLALGLLESAKAYIQARTLGIPASAATVLVGNLPWWLAWAALTPIAIALARRFPLDRRVSTAAAVHLVASIVLSLLHHAAVGALYFYTHTRGRVVPLGGELVEMTPGRQVLAFFGAFFVLNVLTYWATVGGFLGLDYFKRHREGELRAARLEATMHEARLAALRMELNPHFLFNTLNAISGLVRAGDHHAAVRMLARLGDLLRNTLEQGSDPEIPLEKELEALSIYFDIESIRFGPRLSLQLAVDDDVRPALVPAFLLQPLAENAIRHGVARHTGPGAVSVRARRDGNCLEVSIDNTGPREGTAETDAPARGNGIGLDNTRQRLAALYGSAASIRLQPLPGGGARALVRLPLRLYRTDDARERAVLVPV